MPGNSILVRNDPPLFTIIAATPDYLKNSGYAGRPLVGMGVFEAFPANSSDPKHKGDLHLFQSFMQVVETNEVDIMPLQRYDLMQSDGSFTKKIWRASNRPVLSVEGQVAYIIHTAEDITTQLSESEQDIRDMVARAPIGICVLDAATQIGLIANDSFLEIAGRSLDEIVGNWYWDTFSDARPFYEEALNRVIENGVTFRATEVEVPLRRNGVLEMVPVTFVYEPLKNAVGKVTKVAVWVVDNSTQAQARKAISDSESMFRTMAEGTPVLIAVADETGNATYFNKAWTELTGRAMQDFLQRGWADLIHSEDRSRFVNGYLKSLAEKGPFREEFRMQCKEGGYRWLLAYGTPRFDEQGAFRGHISAGTDITDQKLFQQQLTTALEQVRLSKEAAALGTFDMDLKVGGLIWDERCRILFGISHNNPVQYETDFVNGLHPDDRERITTVINDLLSGTTPGGDYDVEYRTIGAEDGIQRWVRAKGKVYFNEQGEAVRFIGSVLDITEKMMAIQEIERLVEARTQELAEAYQKLQSTNKELQRSNQSLEEFAHAASHDLKEPVRKIIFYTNLLKDQLKDQLQDREVQSFARIENATLRMRNLIDDLLLYSHVTERPPDFDSVDLNQKVRNVLEAV
ncbi:hypothetical protein GCM10023184_28300 [Flaviaesturariibacter amylovorans]|uniref:histidine kinase n=2 Tax=Flaviaesturariibacter amylovorans TaxID=1084520 RepID=A0ABP8H4N4_9BACT